MNVVDVVVAMFIAARRPARIRAATATPMARRLLARWSGVRGDRVAWSVAPLPFEGGDTDGLSLCGRIEARILRTEAELSAHVIGNGNDYRWLPPDERPRGDFWIRALAADFIGDALPSLRFLYQVETFLRAAPESTRDAARVLAWISPAGLAEHLVATFAPTTAPTTPTPLEIAIRPGGRLSGGRPGHLLRVAKTLWRAVTAPRRLPEAEIPATEPGRGRLLIQGDHASLNAFPTRGILSWYAESGIPANRMVILFNRADTPLGPRLRSRLREIGFGWVREDGPYRHLERPWRAAAAALWRARHALPRRGTIGEFWRWSRVVDLGLRADGYEALLRRHDIVGMMLGHDDFGDGQVLYALAARRNGTATFLPQWSVYSCQLGALNRMAGDAAFAWGPFHRAFLDHAPHHGPVLQVGVYGADGMDGSETGKAETLRRSLAPTVRLRITLFDSAFGPRGLMWRSAVEDYYRGMLGAILARSDWGCVIKTKHDVVLGQIFEATDIPAMIDALTTEGRCVVADGEERAAVAALAGDVVVACGIATAGMIGAMAGRPAIHVDNGRARHPLKLMPGTETIIAADTDAAVIALERLAAGDRTVGDHGPWIRLIDAHGDWRGAARMGEALRDYLEARDRGAGLVGAVDEMTARFIRRWGAARASLATPDDDADVAALERAFRLMREGQGLVDWPSPFAPPPASPSEE